LSLSLTPDLSTPSDAVKHIADSNVLPTILTGTDRRIDFQFLCGGTHLGSPSLLRGPKPRCSVLATLMPKQGNQISRVVKTTKDPPISTENPKKSLNWGQIEMPFYTPLDAESRRQNALSERIKRAQATAKPLKVQEESSRG